MMLLFVELVLRNAYYQDYYQWAEKKYCILIEILIMEEI